ncbi:hypothetical protein J3U99_23280 [Brucella pituitosa]|uniref:N-acetylglucosamine kinase n=1 Tax=Brucella pituitosa TaxID=571256 RepID=UPI002005309F|nr:BadF/BadG/BcrA/BcrD ATPase family protein [Brucella pituitosa]MCK4207667.1 hypothetical protein [Brucella pituitosa]
MLAAGIDIGATKTQLHIVNTETVLDNVIVATSEWRARVGFEADAHSLANLVARHLGHLRDLSVVVVGAHGCDTDEECNELTAHLARCIPATILVLNDAELLLAASGVRDGVSVISGTGSIAVSRNGCGKLMAAGGWGWYLGDEGGAVGLVREAARLVRSAQDEGKFSDPLVPELCKAYGARQDGSDLGYCISRLGSADKIGAHAHVVFDAVAQGSTLALNVINEAASTMSDKVTLLVARGAIGNRIVTGGSVISSQPLLANAFQAAVSKRIPDWSVYHFAGAPVTGAVNLARSIMLGESLGRLPVPLRYEELP